eukprot:UN34364
MKLFLYTFRHFDKDKKVDEYSFHQLLSLLCPNFPKTYVKNAMTIIPKSEQTFSNVSSVVFMLIFYHQFVLKCGEIFKNIVTKEKNNESDEKIKKLNRKQQPKKRRQKFELKLVII